MIVVFKLDLCCNCEKEVLKDLETSSKIHPKTTWMLANTVVSPDLHRYYAHDHIAEYTDLIKKLPLGGIWMSCEHRTESVESYSLIGSVNEDGSFISIDNELELQELKYNLITREERQGFNNLLNRGDKKDKLSILFQQVKDKISLGKSVY